MQQAVVFATLAAALVLFIWGRWRYDVVAVLALLVVVVTGIVEPAQAFTGFANPAVVTVVAVLMISRSLLNAGVVDMLGTWVAGLKRPTAQVAALTALVALLSGFINNVGALALLIPLAIQMARRQGKSPSYLLMPLAFGSLLGGMTTLIGTPPNLIIAEFRARDGSAPFSMFDFTPVGVGVTAAGILFLSLVGWRLIPNRQGRASREELFEVKDYLAEVRVPNGAAAVGKRLDDIVQAAEADVVMVRLVRDTHEEVAPPHWTVLQAGDVLTVEADPEALKAFIDAGGLELKGDKELTEEVLGSDEVALVEAIVTTQSPIEGSSPKALNLRRRHGVNVLAVARQGQRLRLSLSDIRFRSGDVLLLQMPADSVQETLSALGCLPLAERGLRLAQPRRVALALGIFGVGILLTAFGLLPAAVAFVAVATAMVLAKLLAPREAYQSVDWSVIVLLGALIPVGEALETTGGAALIADSVLSLTSTLSPASILAVLIVFTMIVSAVVNNAAAAVLMAPIALGVATGLDVSADPLLMAVAVGASCAFLTPIGHQSNTLVLGPGGYKFVDYALLGLPLTLVVVLVAIPLLLLVWPL